MVDTKRDALHAAADAGRVVLAVCGGYQLLGHHYELGDERIPGVGLVDLHTVREDGPRLIGNVAIEVGCPGLTGRACSPASRTTAGARTWAPARSRWAACSRATATPAPRASRACCATTSIGTYLHGPLLPKNAWFADWLIATALGLDEPLAALEDDARARRARRRAPGGGRLERRPAHFPLDR